MARPLPDPNLPWPIPLGAVEEIANSEGLRLKAYRCPAGRWTIGWGETDGVRPGDRCSKEQADRWLIEDITDRVAKIRSLCTLPPGDNELGAMCSLAYNIGLDGFAKSTVLRRHNAGDHQAAARAFGLWNKFTNPVTKQLEVSDGLTARRQREAAIYLTPDSDDDAPKPAMPQAVSAESNLAASPIARTGATSVGAGALVGLTSFADDVKGYLGTIKGLGAQAADFIGVTPQQGLALALLVAGGVVLYQRWKQRAQGWA